MSDRFPPPSSSAKYSAIPSGVDSTSQGSTARTTWAPGKKERALTTKGKVIRAASGLCALLLFAAAWKVTRPGELEVVEVGVAPGTGGLMPVENWDLGMDQELTEPTLLAPSPIPTPTPGLDEEVPVYDEAEISPMKELEKEKGELEVLPIAGAATWNLDHCREDASCQFLLPGWIGGQETRGQEHLYRLGLMALALDRILVLPNASHSELGVCLPRAFTFYYDQMSLSTFGISTVTQSEFQSYIDALPSAPTGQRVILQKRGPATEVNETAPPPEVEVGGDLDLRKKDIQSIKCLDDFRIDYSSFEHLAFYGRFADSQEAGTGFVVSFVNHIRTMTGYITPSSNPPSISIPTTPAVLNIAVIVPWWTTTGGRQGVDLSVVHSLNPAAVQPSINFTHVAYAPAWVSATNQINEKLSPFIAIHWRTEQLNVKNFPRCTTALFDTLTQLKLEYPTLTTVYLLTDYPLESLRGHEGEVSPHSASYGRIPKEVSRSMRELLTWFDSGEAGLKLTTWTQEEAEIEWGPVTREALGEGVRLKDLDLSLVGMVDKNVGSNQSAAISFNRSDAPSVSQVAMNAQVFVAGAQVSHHPYQSASTLNPLSQSDAPSRSPGRMRQAIIMCVSLQALPPSFL
ncbi:hypothetical protein P7C70_g7291, partial [Phenoliferia sp. Uapishka_3]